MKKMIHDVKKLAGADARRLVMPIVLSVLLRTANQDVTSRIVEYVEGIRTFRLYHLTGSGFARLDQALVSQKKASERAELSVVPATLAISAVTSMLIPISMLLGTWLFAQGQVEVVTFPLRQSRGL